MDYVMGPVAPGPSYGPPPAWAPAAPAYPAAYPVPYAQDYAAWSSYVWAQQVAQLQQQLMLIQWQIDQLLGSPASPPAPGPAPAPWPAPAPGPGPGPGPSPSPSPRRASFTVSSFNVLGSSHTRAGGEKPQMGPGVQRIHGAVQLLKQHHVDVVGFQEFQLDQAREFQRIAGDTYGVYPGAQHGARASQNSIAWRRDAWDLVKASSFDIPYFEGKKMPMPVVLLRNKQTGQEAYFVNVHNPADTHNHHQQERWRDQAEAVEVAMINRLQATGTPVILTGDMNERLDAFQRFTRGAAMTASHHGPNGTAPRKPGIDWVFGTRGVQLDRWVRDRGALVQRTTDHPMIVSRATIS